MKIGAMERAAVALEGLAAEAALGRGELRAYLASYYAAGALLFQR